MLTEQEEKARVFKAFCDPKRLAIIDFLRHGEQCACKIAKELNMAQSALSYHMKILCEAQVVEFWHVGKWTHYQINIAGCSQAIKYIHEITTPTHTATQNSTHSCINTKNCTQAYSVDHASE